MTIDILIELTTSQYQGASCLNNEGQAGGYVFQVSGTDASDSQRVRKINNQREIKVGKKKTS